MAGRYDRDAPDYTYDTDGGEATPRPLKARRLADVMETAPAGKGRTSAAAQESARRGAGSTVTQACRRPAAAPSDPAPLSREVSAKKPADGAISREVSAKKQADGAISREVSVEKQADKPSAPAESIPSLSPDACAVLSVTPTGEGETVTVVMAMPSPTEGKSQRVSFRLLVEQYAELGVKAGEITPDFAEELLEAGRLCGAIRRGISMLGYGDQSARRLAYKLTAKGVDRDTAHQAVAYLTAKGYIHEDSTATLRAEQGLRKGWGERRIREDLCAHGFTREAVEEAMEALADVDWVGRCAAALRKRYGEIPAERGERQKLMAAMMRLGYEVEDIRAAMGGFAEGDDVGTPEIPE